MRYKILRLIKVYEKRLKVSKIFYDEMDCTQSQGLMIAYQEIINDLKELGE